MGRKSREKKNRLKVGDIIWREETGFTPRGFFKVDCVFDNLIGFHVGSIHTSSSRECLGRYKKVDPARDIDWLAEEKKFEQYWKRRQEQMAVNSEEWDLDLDQSPDSPFEVVSVRKLNMG